MTHKADLIHKMAEFFTSEEFFEKGEDARLELSPDDVRCMNEIIKACDNAISRQAVLDMQYRIDDSATLSTRDVVNVDDIEDLPLITPQSKTEHWLYVEDRTDWYDATYKCSCCGREITTPYDLKNNLYSDYPYCHCGAKMSEVSE